MTVGGELGQQMLQAILGLGTRLDKLDVRMDRLESRMEKLEVRMDKQETWMERLGAEFVRTNTELKTEMQEGFRQVHGRIDRLNEASVLMGSELQRTAQRQEELHQRVLVLEARG